MSNAAARRGALVDGLGRIGSGNRRTVEGWGLLLANPPRTGRWSYPPGPKTRTFRATPKGRTAADVSATSWQTSP
jgi:hypothetical protein